MNDYQLLQTHNAKHKDLVHEAKKIRAANAVQAKQKSEKKNSFFEGLTRG